MIVTTTPSIEGKTIREYLGSSPARPFSGPISSGTFSREYGISWGALGFL